MIKRVICPDCGHEVDSRGLPRHQAGNACRTALVGRQMRERGWKRCGPQRGVIHRAGVELEMALGFVSDGVHDNGRPRRRCRKVAWAPAYIVDAAKFVEGEDELLELLQSSDPEAACEERAAAGILANEHVRGGRWRR